VARAEVFATAFRSAIQTATGTQAEPVAREGSGRLRCACWRQSDGERRAFCRVFSWTSPEIFLNVGHEECAVMIFHGD